MKQEERKDTLEDYLVERVKKSGYPLEIEVSDMLEREKFVVFNTQYYFDEESKQGRDIDIYALPFEPDPIDDRIRPLFLSMDVAIECKKSDTHAWVFYTRPRIPMSSIYMSGQFRTTIPQLEGFTTKSFEWFLQQECLVLHYDTFERIAIAYEEIKKRKIEKEAAKSGRKDSSRREIFEAINQLVKFTCYEIHKSHLRTTKLTETEDNREYITIFFPMIVFDGDIFEVFLASGEPILKRKTHLLLGTHYRCPYCGEVESFTIDVVHRSYFNEFLRTIKGTFYKTIEAIRRNRDKLLEKAKEDRKRSQKEATKK